ncbi:MAG: hypothetical protein HOF96_09655 [Candidatus Marinimicrobia bacterium]|nr:hypothetical protein [Candidatus Neomarinimicrobiota bacterium]MBT3825231.1 hypothetical protein [Candidatus Neomarinimicrobiota bacterium]MBT5314500.1 hypothetical protein [Candidatus Neomarinimicrobiota bacterium]MBT6758687.1 hypothetical protein [Candidatus Neomarinimicrobiota bacterium]
MFYMVFTSFASAQDFYELLNNTLDQPTLTRMNLADLQQTRLKLSSAYSYQDYFREQLSGKDTQSLFGEAAIVNLHAVNARRSFKYGAVIQIQERRKNYSNLNADILLNADYLNEEHDFDLQLACGNERMIWGLRIDQQGTSFGVPMLINEYPSSEDSQMNRYFLDWLEPSFGNEFDAHGEFNLNGLQTYSSLSLGSNLIVNLNYRVSETSFTPVIDYSNNSNIDELKGDRQIVFDGANVNQFLELSLESPQWSFKPTLTLQKNNADLTIENPLPEGVIDDFPELGWLEFSRRGAAFSIESQLENLELELGVGYSQWDANTDMSTPVLGRYWFIPIAHAAQLHISGKSISQHLGFYRELFNRGISVDLIAGYQHAYFDFMVTGEAELEFNIRSIPIHDPLQFHLHVISIGVPIVYSFNSFALHYEINQVLPWLNRVDESPFNFEGGYQPDRKVRGGGQHMIALSYTWR